jgi:hypothetical protein
MLNMMIDSKSLLPINFCLTQSVLTLMQKLFNKPDTLTKYLLLEEVMLFYIRTFYLSFIRLYNTIFVKKQQGGTTKHVQQERDAQMKLIKAHLECLYSIAL